MALEELIVAWSKDRPAWQRAIMRRVATGNALCDADYDSLVDDIVAGKPTPDESFGLEHLPQTTPDALPVRLVSIAKPEHVNALESNQPLTFDPDGLTIVYGDNGSGKSGYARLLKRIARARHQEDVLSDVFRDTSLAKPTALLKVRIGDDEVSLNWPEGARPELRHMLFYDSHCGSQYIAAESDFPYRPAALFVMDRLIEACLAIRSRIDAKLEDNDGSAVALPAVPDELRTTRAGSFLDTLSSGSSIATLDALIKELHESSDTIQSLLAQEGSLVSTDSSTERAKLTRQGDKLSALRKHIERLRLVYSADALITLQRGVDELRTLEQATTALVVSFKSQPLPGVGTDAWKVLWESAMRFSEAEAYRGSPSPVLETGSRCVLCQQDLNAEAMERLSGFDQFVKDDVSVRLKQARLDHEARVRNLVGISVTSEAVSGNLADLDPSHGNLAAECRDVLNKYETLRRDIQAALANGTVMPRVDVNPVALSGRLEKAAQEAAASVKSLEDPASARARLGQLRATRKQLELLQAIEKSRDSIEHEIARLKQKDALEAAKAAAATTGITKKITELSEESITEIVTNHFIRETERLQLQRVTISRTRADKGTLLHQPKLVNPRQQVPLPRVFSEGERTALGLAAFLTEAELEASGSTLILDDPVTSLDHIRRDLVASRLAALATSRQVVVFTHDAAFVADLKRAAKEPGVSIAERSVVRSRADARKPGTCTNDHPWKAKDVPSRFHELRIDLARIKKDSASWDERAYEDAVSAWAGRLSETWERIFSQEIVGPILAEGGLEVRPSMVKVLARFSDDDYREFDASYSRVSQWARRHDKSAKVNYTPPEVPKLEEELASVDAWFTRVKKYKEDKK